MEARKGKIRKRKPVTKIVDCRVSTRHPTTGENVIHEFKTELPVTLEAAIEMYGEDLVHYWAARAIMNAKMAHERAALRTRLSGRKPKGALARVMGDA